ncbi:phosphate-binding protein [Marinobacterium nitratireducens]|uniref:Phosphate-binding protein n=1 Tax=Marinobacterium nitratireducens TaxID=518897 RepID=A0A917Z7X5_9GAMM|nr:phosphate/phosphite/phosphonate ABC transporter substrate-binding protein [Marinobacterium nitratireducens]GGO77742.1 phosphate-binding protein [Marinobacterium nitratireducens]
MRILKPLLLLLLVWSQIARAEPLVLAQVSDRPSKDFEQLRPMVEYAAARLAPLGITSGEVRLYDSAEQLASALQAGDVDWITETPFTAARLMHEAGARPLLRKWKGGQHQYQTLIYTRSDSPIRSVLDLTDRRIAFEHPESFSSYFVPRRILLRSGLQLTGLKDLHQPPPPGNTGYLFSRNEKNNALWVHKGLVDAGALNSGDWENRERVPVAIRRDLRIIYRSETYPRALELVSSELDDNVVAALRELLLAMPASGASEVLASYENSTGFEPLQPGDIELLSDIYDSSRRW